MQIVCCPTLDIVLFPSEFPWHPCQKSSGHLMYGYFWVFYSIPFTDISVFMPVSHCFDYHHFVESWNQEMWIFQLCSLRWLWQFEVLWNAIGILGLAFPFLQDGHWGFEKDNIEPVDHFGSNAILTILSLLIHRQSGCVSIHLCLF